MIKNTMNIEGNKFIVITNPTEEQKKSLTIGQRYYRTKKGYINKNGEIVIKGNFITTKPFSEGLAAVNIGDENYGYINTKGEWVIKPQYTRADEFKNGIAHVKKYDPKVRIEKEKEWKKREKEWKRKQNKTRLNGEQNQNNSLIIFSIILLTLILSTGYSIKKSIKKAENEKSDK